MDAAESMPRAGRHRKVRHLSGRILASSRVGPGVRGGSTDVIRHNMTAAELSNDGAMQSDSPLILVVDDNPAMLELTSFTLLAGGYRTETSDSGALVMQRVAEHRPDLILLDLMMPGIDGFAVLRLLRAEPTTRDIPVVVLSAADETLGMRALEHYGADPFWGKHEINLSTLRERVASVIRSRQSKVRFG